MHPEFAAYYQTPEWRVKREACFRHYGWKCQVCADQWRRSGARLQCHHKHYRTFRHEDPIRDLIPLCTDHHPKGTFDVQQHLATYAWLRVLTFLLWRLPLTVGRSLWAVGAWTLRKMRP